MPLNLQCGDRFPDLVLPDTTGAAVRLSCLVAPSELDRRLGFTDGYPLIVHFYRGFFCPRDQRQFRDLVAFHGELQVNYAKLVSISVEPSIVQAAFRAGLGAGWPFLSDESRTTIRAFDILDETEGEYPEVAQPYTLVLRPDLTIHVVYPGWWYVGRPTADELHRDLRAVMETRRDYAYAAYNDPAVKQVRIPAQDWAEGTPPLGAGGLPVAQGIVQRFSLGGGYGTIVREGDSAAVFFSFTAIPGQGYRTIAPETPVRFEVVDGPHGLSARNVQPIPKDAGP